MSLFLKVEVIAGTSEGEAAQDLVRLAEKLNVGVETEFNGVTMFAAPSQTAQDVLLEYERTCRLLNYPED